MTESITVTLSNGHIAQAFAGECTIRRFRTMEDMKEFMKITNNAKRSDVLAFYKYCAGLTNQYTPIHGPQQLLEIAEK